MAGRLPFREVQPLVSVRGPAVGVLHSGDGVRSQGLAAADRPKVPSVWTHAGTCRQRGMRSEKGSAVAGGDVAGPEHDERVVVDLRELGRVDATLFVRGRG